MATKLWFEPVCSGDRVRSGMVVIVWEWRRTHSKPASSKSLRFGQGFDGSAHLTCVRAHAEAACCSET